MNEDIVDKVHYGHNSHTIVTIWILVLCDNYCNKEVNLC